MRDVLRGLQAAGEGRRRDDTAVTDQQLPAISQVNCRGENTWSRRRSSECDAQKPTMLKTKKTRQYTINITDL